MKRKSLRRFKKDEMSLEINSLLDILVILLVFLIKNFSATNIDIPIPKELVVPISKSLETNEDAVTVSLTKENEVYVNQEVVDEIDPNNESRMISSLYNELLVQKERIKSTLKSEGRVISSVVNVVVDENVEFEQIKKILYTLKEADFKEYKFITTQ